MTLAQRTKDFILKGDNTMRMTYLGEDISEDMVVPVLNGFEYDVNITPAPVRNQNGEIKQRLVVFVHELEDDKCIATLPYREDDWREVSAKILF